ncbi:MAG: DUF4081 domain-containing protein [Myxococcaceae bacterium]|nr:DUF4081 domain-containing protein [Myxococcaceae bacterium]
MAVSVEPLRQPHLDTTRALLAREPAHNLYLLGILEDFGVVAKAGAPPFTFHGRFVDGELTAVLFVGLGGSLVVPSASPSNAIADLAKALAATVKPLSLMGDKGAIDVLVQHLCPTAKPQLNRTQRLFACSADDLGPFTNPTLRLAVETDLAELVPMAAAAVREQMERDPLAIDPKGFAERVKLKVKAKRTYVLEDKDKRLVFKLDIGSRCPHGAELEGLYTIPEQRRLHHATLSLGQISRHLLSSLPRLTMRVDDNNAQLAGLARKVGYLAGRAQRTVVI